VSIVIGLEVESILKVLIKSVQSPSNSVQRRGRIYEKKNPIARVLVVG